VIRILPHAKKTSLKILCGLYFILLILSPINSLYSQETPTSDELFINARKAAFEDDNYPQAIALTKQALELSPDYADIRIFLGRIYTWTDEVEKARKEFVQVLEKNRGYEDAVLAYGSLEYWNDNSEKALGIVEDGIQYNPGSQDLLVLKAKILIDLRRYSEGNETLNYLLKINPKHTDARALSAKIQDVSSKNKIGASYDFVYFDERFDDPWHLASIDYGRQTKFGSVIARLNYANRFNADGTQFEIDAYPRLSKVFYAYVNGGIAKNDGIFPKYRAGFSLYANLPLAFEADAGFRLLVFNDETWIYTASIGKYYKNYWFNLRTYLTPSNNSVSQSVSLKIRYYLGGAEDYLSFGIGTGLSPDDPANNILFNNDDAYKLKSSNISLGYNKSINALNIISVKASLENQEYRQGTRGNQFSVGIGYNRRF